MATPAPTKAQHLSPAERLTSATALSALGNANLRPWHLKIAATLFDEHGKNPVEGTIERWQNGDEWRTVSSFGPTLSTVVHHDGKEFRSLQGPALATAADDLLRGVLHPGPDEADLEGATPELRKQSFGKTSLDCIMLGRPIPRVAFAPLGLFSTYCLTPEGDHLNLGIEYGSQITQRTKLAKFLGHEVTLELAISQNEVFIGRAKVTDLATYKPAAGDFEPTSGMQLAAKVRVSGAVIAGYKLTGPNPSYPADARERRVGGRVVLRAFIGVDGKVRSLSVMSAGDPSLALASVAAVRQWTYKPYLLNGMPTEVDTTIPVNFNLSSTVMVLNR